MSDPAIRRRRKQLELDRCGTRGCSTIFALHFWHDAWGKQIPDNRSEQLVPRQPKIPGVRLSRAGRAGQDDPGGQSSSPPC